MNNFTSYLAMSIQNASEESVGVWEALRSSALSYTDYTVLLGMQYTTLECSRILNYFFKCLSTFYVILRFDKNNDFGMLKLLLCIIQRT